MNLVKGNSAAADGHVKDGAGGGHVLVWLVAGPHHPRLQFQRQRAPLQSPLFFTFFMYILHTIEVREVSAHRKGALEEFQRFGFAATLISKIHGFAVQFIRLHVVR